MRVILFTLSALFAISPAQGVAADAPLSAAQRQVQIERIRDGLNSPDPTKRIVTLEQAVASKDRTIRRVALSTAFASSDPDLRGAALTAAMASTASFVVDITGPDSTNKSRLMQQGLGASFEVRVAQFNPSTNTFRTSARSSRGSGGLPGSVSGDRLSFEINTDVLTLFVGHSCTGVARLNVGTSRLAGTMSCTTDDSPENYSIAIDVPT